MDFRKGPRPRDYLTRHEQWRLLLLVLALGLVVVLILQTRQSENWRWLDVLEPTPQGQSRPSGPSAATSPTDSAAGHAASGAALKVDHDLLKTIEDDTTFRDEEKDAWFGLLEVLRKADASSVERASRGQADFAQIARQSDAYRGTLLTVRGAMRRASHVKAPHNDRGIAGYWQTWIQTENADNEPVVAYLLELPKGFPTGTKIAEDVTLTGFYFKRWAYLAADGVRVAPVLLAKTVRWQQRPAASRETPRGDSMAAVAVALALGMSILAMAYVYFRTRRRPRPAPETPLRLDTLNESNPSQTKES